MRKAYIPTNWWLAGFIVSIPLMLNNPAAPFINAPALGRLQISEFLFVGLVITAWWEGRLGWRDLPRTPLIWAVLLYLGAAFFSIVTSNDPMASLVEAIAIGYLAAIFLVLFQVFRSESALVLGIQSWLVALVVVILGGLMGIILLIGGIETSLASESRIIPVALSIHDYVPWFPRVTSTLQPTANLTAAFLGVAIGLLVPWATASSVGHSKTIAHLAWAGALLLAPLTFSRAIMGILLSWVISFRSRRPAGLALRLGGTAILVGIVLLLPLLSVWYIRDVQLVYETDLSAQKEIVDLGENRLRENPVYFFRENTGAEKLTFQVDYAYNHYFWLKRASWEMFQDAPLAGVGAGNFLSGLHSLGASPGAQAQVNEYSLPYPTLASQGYVSAQSQVFTTLAEQGALGVLALAVLWVAAFRFLWRGVRQTAGLFQQVALGSLAACAGILLTSIDMDVMNFRFVWVALAMGVAATQLGLAGREHADEG